MQWQRDAVAIPAPPFGEQARADWMEERFLELGLQDVRQDEAGNVLGWAVSGATSPDATDAPCLVLSAHIDTVFPASTVIEPLLDDGFLRAPGACDNGAGIAGLLAMAAAIQGCGIDLPAPLLFVGNVGEEGEGDLRGMRCLYANRSLRNRIAAHVVLDGAEHNLVVTRAIGSRRYLVQLRGPGGHSWTDAGTPNPVVALSHVITRISAFDLSSFGSSKMNVGTIEGGNSVNSIPESARARFDLRSLDPGELTRLEVELYRAVEDSVSTLNSRAQNAGRENRSRGPLKFEIIRIGNRPAGELADTAPILESLKAVDRHLGIRTEPRSASTDANIPISLEIPAVSMGAGGSGGGIHAVNEWYDSRGRELALKRILLFLLSLL